MGSDAGTGMANRERTDAKRMETLCAPQEGILLSLTALDPMTCPENRDRRKKGFAVDGKIGDIVSPVGGTVISLHTDGNAVSIQSDKGVELLVRVGGRMPDVKDSVHVYAERGSHVAVGQRLFHADLDRIRRAGGRTACVVLLQGQEENGAVEEKREPGGTVRAGFSPVMTVWVDDKSVQGGQEANVMPKSGQIL